MNDRDRQDPAITQRQVDIAPQPDVDTDARLLGGGGPTLGERIQRAREAKNMDQADLVGPLNLDLRVIVNVEQDRLDQAPGRPFIIAYIKSWAEQLDLDPEALIAQYQAQTAPPSGQVNGGQHPTLDVMDEGRGRLGKWLTAIFVIGLLAVVAALAVQFGADHWSQWFAADHETISEQLAEPTDSQSAPATPEVALRSVGLPEQRLPALDEPPPMPQAQSADGLAPPPALGATDSDAERTLNETTAEQDVPAVEPDQPVPATEPEESLELRASGGDCWIEVRSADGERLMYDVLSDGDSRAFSGDGPFSLVLGNPAVMEVFWEGELVELNGNQDATGILRIEVGG